MLNDYHALYNWNNMWLLHCCIIKLHRKELLVLYRATKGHFSHRVTSEYKYKCKNKEKGQVPEEQRS
ncbi:hypothetical protein L2E82_32878 [Cichorium intybus]|uniref:Uncharacterized protein n=1 Tax=Cichorium intybus TaxID=13427 RepID=A0ACB9BH37_CICIN|nr:hypothetical protein L2E82_32878 [Cichorium intybus]